MGSAAPEPGGAAQTIALGRAREYKGPLLWQSRDDQRGLPAPYGQSRPKAYCRDRGPVTAGEQFFPESIPPQDRVGLPRGLYEEAKWRNRRPNAFLTLRIRNGWLVFMDCRQRRQRPAGVNPGRRRSAMRFANALFTTKEVVGTQSASTRYRRPIVTASYVASRINGPDRKWKYKLLQMALVQKYCLPQMPVAVRRREMPVHEASIAGRFGRSWQIALRLASAFLSTILKRQWLNATATARCLSSVTISVELCDNGGDRGSVCTAFEAGRASARATCVCAHVFQPAESLEV